MPSFKLMLPQAVLLLAIALIVSKFAAAGESDATSTRTRRPVALAASNDTLFVANRDSGTISLIDLKQRRVLVEQKVGSRLADLKCVPGTTNELLTIDETGHVLIHLQYQANKLIEKARHPVARYPVTLAVSKDCQLCSAASLWSRRLTMFKLDDQLHLTRLKTIDLPFAPRLQLFLNCDWLLVADSFGGRMALVNLSDLELAVIRTLEGHNIRGLALSSDGKQLLVTHQLLNSNVPTTRSRVFWGTVMGNVLRVIAQSHLLPDELAGSVSGKAVTEPIGRWSLIPLGEPERASGDPAAIVVTPGGKAIVTLAGVDEVIYGEPESARMSRHQVGRGPSALAFDEQRNLAYIANTYSDSISVFDLREQRVTETIGLGDEPALSIAQKGEILFRDARLSLDGWYSCHSCHTDGHSNGLRNDNFADDTTGAPKQVLSLLGASQTGPWSWKGGRKSLSEQILKSIESTMHGEGQAAAAENVVAIEAYLKGLRPPPSLAFARDQLDRDAMARGRQVFETQGCVDCHQAETLTSADSYDIGLTDEAGWSKFNPPSLRGVSQRDRLFHDGRAKNVPEIITRFRHGLESDLSESETRDLLDYLSGI